jgi:hypothetical protein
MPAESFPTDPTGLPEATRPALLELADGDDLHLRGSPRGCFLLGASNELDSRQEAAEKSPSAPQ